MTEWLDGFKVVRKDRGKYYSCSLPKGVRQEYRIGKPTKRRNGNWGALAVFKKEKNAKDFVLRALTDDLHIKKCKYKLEIKRRGKHRKLAKILFVPSKVYHNNRQYFYLMNVYNGCAVFLTAPEGTAFADEVILGAEICP